MSGFVRSGGHGDPTGELVASPVLDDQREALAAVASDLLIATRALERADAVLASSQEGARAAS